MDVLTTNERQILPAKFDKLHFNRKLTSPLISPETDLEAAILDMPEIQDGLWWGEPRTGHPEGLVILHIREILANIDTMQCNAEDRAILRLSAIVHDTFKNREEHSRLSGTRIHHGIFAAQFLESIAASDLLIRLVRWHDEAFYAWRYANAGDHATALKKLSTLMDIFGADWHLYLQFFHADTLTGDKTPKPLYWLEKNLNSIR